MCVPTAVHVYYIYKQHLHLQLYVLALTTSLRLSNMHVHLQLYSCTCARSVLCALTIHCMSLTTSAISLLWTPGSASLRLSNLHVHDHILGGMEVKNRGSGKVSESRFLGVGQQLS